MTELFFATYDELVLLTKAWKMHGSLSYIEVNILIELASNSARYTGGKMNTWVAIPICARYIYQNQARSDGPPETTRAATSSCMRLVQSIIYNLHL